MGSYYLYGEKSGLVLFTENETNRERLFNQPNASPSVKDAFHDAVITNDLSLVGNRKNGTKSAFMHRLTLAGGESVIIKLRLRKEKIGQDPFGNEFDEVFKQRITEADEFYSQFAPDSPESDVISVQRQAFAGLLWNKQYYNYELDTWLNGDPGQPASAGEQKNRSKRRLEISLQSRCDLHAGQMGISLVCKLGPRVPLRPVRHDRP